MLIRAPLLLHQQGLLLPLVLPRVLLLVLAPLLLLQPQRVVGPSVRSACPAAA
jgi:hypothetical protein